MKEITSVHNPQVQRLRELQKAKYRRESGLFLAESAKMVREAIALNLCRTLIVDGRRRQEHEGLMADAQAAGCEVLLVTEAIMQAISEQKTPQGICCTVQIPQEPQRLSGRLLVAMDGVQDPGNVGTILRTADAAGLDGAILSEQCADVFGPKTLRATMGSVFRVPVTVTDDLPGYLRGLRTQGYSVLSSQLDGEPFYQRGALPGRVCVIIGNEGQGITRRTLDSCTHRFRLPMHGGAESLNAAIAAAIMMYDLMNARR